VRHSSISGDPIRYCHVSRLLGAVVVTTIAGGEPCVEVDLAAWTVAPSGIEAGLMAVCRVRLEKMRLLRPLCAG